jgi:GAD-like domain
MQKRLPAYANTFVGSLGAKMSAEEFYSKYGKPNNSQIVPDSEVLSARGRLPVDLIDFWTEHGIGSYANDLFWLCTPSLLQPVLDSILANVPHLSGQVAAFAYDAKGVVHLWHTSGRHYVLFLPFGVIDDQTSRRETAPVPYDLADIYRAAGIEMGPGAVESYLASRNTPEEIWSILYGSASLETYKQDLGEDLRPLPAALKAAHGTLRYGEIYCRMPGKLENKPASFERIHLLDTIPLLPDQITVSHAVEKDGQQDIVELHYPSRPQQ